MHSRISHEARRLRSPLMQQSAAVQELAELAAMQVDDDEGSEQVEVDAEADEGRVLL